MSHSHKRWLFISNFLLLGKVETMTMSDLKELLGVNLPVDDASDDWSFAGRKTGYLTHGLLGYPARMIPQIARKLILLYSNEGELIWDPFCGSGTTLVESILLGRKGVGTDLNPFAIFLSKVKTTPLSIKDIRETEQMIMEEFNQQGVVRKDALIPSIYNINYWFKKYVQEELAQLLQIINQISDTDLRNFFLLCFASTTRDASNLRKNEFKIVRMKEDKLNAFKPKVKEIFVKHIERCIPLIRSFSHMLAQKKFEKPKIIEIDNRFSSIEPGSVDLIVTSPPYGDSATTVAYGQFSKFPALWIGLDHDQVISVDRRSLGGTKSGKIDTSTLQSTSLYSTYQLVRENSNKRAEDLFRFFIDLNGSLESMYEKLREKGRACIVVGNRLMSRVRIPTDKIVVELGKPIGFEHNKTIFRNIPTKRMPWRNAPENKKGEKADTMHTESIIILVKP